MAMRSDVRFHWSAPFRPQQPVADPGLDIDELENAHALEIGNRTFTGKDFAERGGVDDSVRGEPSAQ